MSLAVITPVTGHPANAHQAGKLPYLNETIARCRWDDDLTTASERRQLLGKNRCMYAARPGGPPVRVPAQILRVTGADGITREKGTGTITEEYLNHLDEMEAQGYQIYQRIVVGPQVLRHDHGYVLAKPRGTIMPASWRTRLQAREMGWTPDMPGSAAMKILACVIRKAIRSHRSIRRAVKTRTSAKKVSKNIVAHNLAIAPHPRILEQIRRAGQPVDQVLELIARRAIERMERKRGAQITAVCSTHLQDSKGFRPHLHIRMVATDSRGEPIALFNRKTGGSGGGPCILQAEIERDLLRIIEIERDRPRERN
jgi:hypothetical protein